MKLKNIPNILSIIRILLIFVFVYTFFALDSLYVALLVFLVAGATDVVDGYLARRYNWITTLGKILDPVADKMMQFAALICLLIKGLIPWWFAAIFFAKELTILGAGLLVIKRRDVAVVSKWYGKVAVCVFYATIAVTIIFKDFLLENPLITAVICLPAIGFALGALFAYIKHYSYLKKEEVKRGYLLKNRKEQ